MTSVSPSDTRKMRRSDVVLLAMATACRGTLFEPARLRSLLFLVDRELSEFVGGPHFHFQPHVLGPFDQAVYEEMDALSRSGRVSVTTRPDFHAWALTPAGLQIGAALFADLPADARSRLTDLVRQILGLRFEALLAEIYRRHPDIAAPNEAVARYQARKDRRRRYIGGRPFLDGMARAFDLTGWFHAPRGPRPEPRSDAEALREDWMAVGDDLRAAMADFATTRQDGRS